MKLILLANIIICVCAFAGFIYGIVKFFKPRKAVYAQMIALVMKVKRKPEKETPAAV